MSLWFLYLSPFSVSPFLCLSSSLFFVISSFRKKESVLISYAHILNLIGNMPGAGVAQIGVRFPEGAGISFLSATASRPAVRPTQPPVQWVLAFFLGVRRPGHEVYQSPLCRGEVKNAWNYTSTPQYFFMMWYLVKDG
jgi:hypothetical protein